MIKLSDITSVHWQPALGSLDVVEGFADIDQCLQIIVSTPKGSDPHRPLFGCDAGLYLDYPANVALPHIVREVSESLRAWEPRIELVSVVPTIDGSHGKVRITWQVAEGVLRETVVAL